MICFDKGSGDFENFPHLPTMLVTAHTLLHTPTPTLPRRTPSPLALERRAVFSLPLLLLPLSAPAADTFDFVENGPPATLRYQHACNEAIHWMCPMHAGKVKQLTEIEARGALTKKVEAATAAGKGIDVDRRGVVNEKALFSEDFYFKYGLRPTPAEVVESPFLPPQAELPFAPVQRRYTGYQKYQGRINGGLTLFSGELRSAIEKGCMRRGIDARAGGCKEGCTCARVGLRTGG